MLPVIVMRFYIGSDNGYQSRQKHFIFISAAAIETARLCNLGFDRLDAYVTIYVAECVHNAARDDNTLYTMFSHVLMTS